MTGFESFSLNINGSVLLLIALLLFLVFYGWYVYRFTLPEVSPFKRYLLMGLRIAVIITVLFLLFEPVANLFFKKELKPVNIVAFDNSASIRSGKDSVQKVAEMKQIMERYAAAASQFNFHFIEFSGSAETIESDSLMQLQFSGKATDMSAATGYTDKDLQPASLTIVSDGIINKGINPLSTAENSPYPVFTIAIGDTSAKRDAAIKNILHNEVVYAGTVSPVTVYILSNGFSGSPVEVRLYEDDRQVGSANITLQDAGINTAAFEYKPAAPGEKKLTASVQLLEGDEQPANNKKISYIKVLDDKVNVLLFAGYPSSDVTFIKSALAADTALSVNSLTQISAGKFLEGAYSPAVLENADIVFLLNFPAAETPQNILDDIRKQIGPNRKPFFLQVTPFSDLRKFRDMQTLFPVELVRGGDAKREILPELNPEFRLHPIIRAAAESNAASVNALPPVIQPGWELRAKTGTIVLMTSRLNNVKLPDPMLVLQSFGRMRSIFFSGSEIWKWKLRSSSAFGFDRFIQGSVKWLASMEDKKLLEIKPVQKLFSESEEIEFTAELVDESFEPLTGENISLRIKKGSFVRELIMSEAGFGLYEGVFENIPAGEYTYYGDVKRDGKIFSADSGRINIGEIDLEQLNLRTDGPLLAALAIYTGGKTYTPANYNEVFPEYERLLQSRIKTTTEVKEYRIWANEYILFFLVLLLSIEWFIRKRAGML